MLQFTCIGNLGADAHIEQINGRPFVSFNVGHNRTWVDANGVSHESTDWVSCALNGDGGNLLKYLTKGRAVFVQGRGSTRVYSSPKEHRMLAGLNISVDRIELLASSTDNFPRQLADREGLLHNVTRYYWMPKEEAKQAGATAKTPAELYDKAGRPFIVDKDGWVTEVEQPADVSQSTDNQVS